MDYSHDRNIKQIKGSKWRTAKTRNKFMILIARLFFALVIIFGFALGGAVIGAYMGVVESAPRREAIAITPTIYPSIIVDQQGREITRLTGEENREYVTIDRIPLHLQQAFIAIEDERFMTHNGVDLRGMVRALHHNLTEDTVQGASTITQQTIKNNVMGIPRNTLGTKIQEIYLAIVFERDLVELLGSREAAKDHILEVYLNTINLHHGLRGVMTAARYYFDKDVSELTISESAVIAAITQNPSRLSPINNPERNRARKLLVLDNMLRLEFITEEEHAYAAADTDVYARIVANERVTEQLNSVHSYFVDSLIQQVATDLSETFAVSRAEAFHWMHTGGLRIYATKDSEMQAIMDAAFMDDTLFPTAGFSIDVHYYASKRNTLTGRIEHVERRGNVARADEIEPLIEVMRSQILRDNEYIFAERIVPIPQPQAAMVVMDWRTGHVKAISGGRGEKMLNLGLNRAVDSRRQPGSVFKTIASFAPAIDLGRVHAGTLINDAPFTFEGYTPRNWYEGFWGPSSIRRGMAQSMNVLSVINMINTGIEDSFRYVLNFGFTTIVTPENPVVRGNQVFHDMVPSLPLGGLTWGVTQLELTAAFAAIANDGQFNYAKFYTRVVDREGRILLEAVPVQRQILRPQAAYILTDMMRDVVTHGTGTHTRLRNTNIPVSGKTGTTTNTHDLMFTGYTPFLAASIWMGYDQPERLRTNTHHMLLWREVMEGIHADFEFRDFVQPSGIIRGTFCGISGQRPVHGRCRQIVTDLFIVGDRTNENCLVCTQEDFRPLLMMLEEPEDDAAGDNYGEDISVGYPVNGDDITEYNGTEVDDETGQPQTIPNEPEDDITQPPTWLPPGGTGLPPDHPGDAVPPVSYPEDDSDAPPWLNLT